MLSTRTLVAGALVALIASCGGSGGQQANKDATNDTPIGGGDGAHDRPADGGAGDSSGGDTGGTPGHPLGTSCLAATECASGFCVDGVCCNGACAGTCLTCACKARSGPACPPMLGTDPRDQCDESGARPVARPACATEPARATSTPPASSASRCRARDDAEIGAAATAMAPARRRPPRRARRSMRGSDSHCMVICANDADCVAPNSCINGSCGKKPIGATCGNAARVQLRVLRAGDLLRQGLHGHLPIVRGAGQRRHLHRNVPDGQDPLGQCADETAATCGSDGMCDGKGGLPAVRGRGRSASSPACAGVDRHAGGPLRRRRHVHARAPSSRASPYLCGTERRVPDVVHDQRRLLGRQRLRRTVRAASDRTVSTAPAAASAKSGCVPAGRLLHRTVHRAPARRAR